MNVEQALEVADSYSECDPECCRLRDFYDREAGRMECAECPGELSAIELAAKVLAEAVREVEP